MGETCVICGAAATSKLKKTGAFVCNQKKCAVNANLQSIDSTMMQHSQSSKKNGIAELKRRLFEEMEDDILSATKSLKNPYKLNWKYGLTKQRVEEMAAFTNAKLTENGAVAADETRLTIDRNPGGFAIFQNAKGRDGKGRYDKWTITDQPILHNKPAPHADFFWMTATMFFPADLRNVPFHEISESIIVNVREHKVSAGCHFRGAGVATLSIVKQFLDRDLTFNQAKDTYDRRIKQLAAEQPDFEKGGPTPLTDIYEAYVLGTL